MATAPVPDDAREFARRVWPDAQEIKSCGYPNADAYRVATPDGVVHLVKRQGSGEVVLRCSPDDSPHDACWRRYKQLSNQRGGAMIHHKTLRHVYEVYGSRELGLLTVQRRRLTGKLLRAVHQDATSQAVRRMTPNEAEEFIAEANR